MRLEDWIIDNKIIVNEVKQCLFEIESVGTFLLLEPKDGKIINKEFGFELDDIDFHRIEKYKPNYFLFEFGERWYYSNIESVKNAKGQTLFKVNFNNFQNLYKVNEEIFYEKFCHLGIHSEYELLNGSGALEDWVNKAKFYDVKTLAICDKNTLAGTMSFQLSCQKKGVKSIIGETVTVVYDFVQEQYLKHDVKLYVKNKQGWKNLLRINKLINVDYVEQHFISEEELFNHSEGLILVFCKESILFEKGIDNKKFQQIIQKYSKHFECYFQIDTVQFSSEVKDKQHLDVLSFYFNNFVDKIEPILINDSYYIDKEQYKLKYFLNSVDKKVFPESEDQYFKTSLESVERIYPLFAEKLYCNFTVEQIIQKLFENTEKLSEHCNFSIETGVAHLPKYDFCEDPVQKFFELVELGVRQKLVDKIEDLDFYIKRIETEIEVIMKGNLASYFLILWDIVKWCKDNDIYVGTGRGSVCGSLVAYVLDITTIDPIKHDLLFERFMNETRFSSERAKSGDSMPDVDLDFESNRREEVKKYCIERFGNLQVCYIGAYGRMKMKGVLKDFCRIKGLNHTFVNFITKQIPNQLEYDWGDLIKYATFKPVLKEFVQKNHDICNLMNFCLGQARSKSIHASAVIITPKYNEDGEEYTIFDWMPIRLEGDILVSEWEGKYTDRGGFLKEDILSLNQLDKFKLTLNLIKKNRKQKLILEEIPLDDEKTYKLFKKGYNEDVFQFTSPGLKSYSIKVKPDNIEDLIAMSALYRPGPMESNAHLDFADIKHGKKKPQYDPYMENITKNTFGLYVYQEQIMQAMVQAGFSLVEADQIRTFIKKFDKEKMSEFKEKFIEKMSELLIKL